MALLFVVLPLNASYLFMILNVIIQLSSRIEIALLSFFGLLFMFLFYSSFSRRENILVVLSIFALSIGFPYFLPLFAGLYFGITAIIPIAIGLFIWMYSPVVMGMVSTDGVIPADASILNIGLDEVLEAFESIQQNLAGESYLIQNWLTASILIFTVFIFVYISRKLSINYAKEIGIAFGTILNIFVFIAANVMGILDFNIGMVILGSIVSAALIYAISFFDVALDYKRAENVEFQDEDYFYYVKLIPKRKSVSAVLARRKQEEEQLYEMGNEEEELAEEDEIERRYVRQRQQRQQVQQKRRPPQSPRQRGTNNDSRRNL